MGALRIAVVAKGKLKSIAIPGNIELPPDANPEEIFGGSHYPLSLRVLLDNEVVIDETSKPAGESRISRISALEYLPVLPDHYNIAIQIKENDGEFRQICNQGIRFIPAEVILLEYNET